MTQKFSYRILLGIILLAGCPGLNFAQATVVEIRGSWKKSDGTRVSRRQKLSANAQIQNASNQEDDAIVVIDKYGKVAPCLNGCRTLVVPAESWSDYIWCKLVGCDVPYDPAGTKGDECGYFAVIGVIDGGNMVDLTALLDNFPGASGTLKLKFRRKVGDNIEVAPVTVKVSDPRVSGLQPGFYDAADGDRVSRILILTAADYEPRKKEYEAFLKEIDYWKKQGLSNCTIKRFTVNYLSYVAKTLKKGKKKT